VTQEHKEQDLCEKDKWKGYRYDPETGDLFREFSASGVEKRQVGAKNGHGYLCFGHKGEKYRLSVVAYEMMTGKKLKAGQLIDHINGIKTDNRWSNLRLSNYRKNSQNRKIHRDGKLVGSSFEKKSGKYRSRIKIKDKHHNLGLFATEQEAHEAYMKVCAELGD
jgi:hypothetical protein